MKPYWPRAIKQFSHKEEYLPGCHLDLNSLIALKLVETWGMVAGASRDDAAPAGTNPGLKLLSPTEVVTRAFEVADLFIEEAEKRGGLSPITEGRSVIEPAPDIREVKTGTESSGPSSNT